MNNNYITTEEVLKRFNHGDKITCYIAGIKITDAKISIKYGEVFICQNIKNGHQPNDKLGYKLAWEYDKSVTNLKKAGSEFKNFADKKLRQLLMDKNII